MSERDTPYRRRVIFFCYLLALTLLKIGFCGIVRAFELEWNSILETSTSSRKYVSSVGVIQATDKSSVMQLLTWGMNWYVCVCVSVCSYLFLLQL